MIKVGVIGGTGYTGVELLRLLVMHPQAEIAAITSRGEAGVPVADLFMSLRGYLDLKFVDPGAADLKSCDVVFSATPNGIAMTYARELLGSGTRLIDVAADFRLKDVDTWEHWYGMKHACPELLVQAVYGLPELYRDEIRTAQLVANPGCYPTAVILGLLPLVEGDLADPATIIADAKSGVSGAGRNAKVGSLLAEVSDSFKAYAVPGHRHTPEINQALSFAAGGKDADILFVPHLTPMIRGIHATLYADLKNSATGLQQRYEERYADEPFVDVLPADSHPDTRSVRGANLCRIAVHRPGGGGRAVVLSVIDNLVKGAAGQAVQNMNIMFGLDETGGLVTPALLP
ncbi:MAG: N-acetyl-gamma-glutamyl-phosphate reductase [Gammaproteobacteria bacterium]|nr:N-acetyl-gamma-glutamyl-phosphate reductase [Gammaproteobacteria bacterium]